MVKYFAFRVALHASALLLLIVTTPGPGVGVPCARWALAADLTGPGVGSTSVVQLAQHTLAISGTCGLSGLRNSTGLQTLALATVSTPNAKH